MATRAQAVALAESYIGCRTGDKRHRRLVDTFNSVKPHGEIGNYSCAWCAITWTAIMIQLKMDRTKTAYSYNCGTLINDSKKIGIWVENDAYVPFPGDGVIYYWSDSGKGDCKYGASHVGIVQKVEKGYIYVIEGNKGGGYCGVRALKVNSRYIRGFMTPKYDDAGNFETTKLDIDGSWGTMTTLVSQQVLGTFADGMVSQQDKDDKKYCPACESGSWEWVKNPKGGSSLVKAIQRMLNVKADGFMGPITIKALQLYLAVSQTGKLDKDTVKAWQKWVNKKLSEKNKPKETPKPTTPAASTTTETPKTSEVKSVKKVEVPTTKEIQAASMAAIFYDMNEWAKKTAKGTKYQYKKYSSNKNTHKCPICHPGSGNGWNCIGWWAAIWYHGGDLKSKCACDAIDDPTWNKLLTLPIKDADKLATKMMGVKVKVIRNGGKTLPFSKLKKGDGLAFYHGSSYYHTAYYQGGKRYSDSTTGRSDEIKASMTLSGSLKNDLKLALRYVGPGRDYLSRGASGTAVKKIQKIVGCEADGEFGPITEATVKKWQKAHGLKDDGLVGPKTLAKMKEA